MLFLSIYLKKAGIMHIEKKEDRFSSCNALLCVTLLEILPTDFPLKF